MTEEPNVIESVETPTEAAPEAAVSSVETNAAEATEAAPAERDWEKEAQGYGWVPKEQFKGDPERWRDAEAFVKRGEEFLPFVQKKALKLEEKLASIEAQHKDEVGRLTKVFESVNKRIKAEFEEKVAKLETDRKEAVRAGDEAAFDRIDTQLQQMKADGPTDDAKPDEVVQKEWMTANDWYENDPVLRAAAYGFSNEIRNPEMSLEENLKRTVAFIKEKFPEKFGAKATPTPAANGHAAVDGGSAFPTASRETEKSERDLPADAKAAGEKFVKDGTFKDMKAYAKAYWQEN